MNIFQYIWYKLREIDSMYYEVLAYAIITGLVCGGFSWIIGLLQMALNEKQEKFAQNYILHRNATEAAKAAGPRRSVPPVAPCAADPSRCLGLA